MTYLITQHAPERWQDLEEAVSDILAECGMDAARQVRLEFPRGGAVVDVVASETKDAITTRIICECKNWSTKIPQEVVHGFRTIMQEAGAHRGYIISKKGFQAGAVEAAKATNIELVTFAGFQFLYFDKWLAGRLWAIEKEVGAVNTYYEPFGIPGLDKLEKEAEREAYYQVWLQYLFIGCILPLFSPYSRLISGASLPALPLDTSTLEEKGIMVPDEIKVATGYRELLQLVVKYARAGLGELRAMNPNTRNKADLRGDE